MPQELNSVRSENFSHPPIINTLPFTYHVVDHTTPADIIRGIHALRYEVYCKECQFLPTSDYCDGLERDCYDKDSVHFYALNNRQDIIGSVRLVPSDDFFPFPLEEHHAGFYPDAVLPEREKTMEISRLVVSKHYRRRKGDTRIGVTSLTPQEQAANAPAGVERRTGSSNEITLGLYRAIYHYSKETGIEHWYAAMEPALARILMRLQFSIYQIGPVMEYYGPVAPYLAGVKELENSLGQQNPEFLSWFQDRRLN